jgi:hypothetical protein
VTCALGAGGATAAHAGPPPPINLVPPTVTGKPLTGENLGRTTGVWTMGGTPYIFTQEWKRCDVQGNACVGTGVTTEQYYVTGADIGHTIRVAVTNTADNGNNSPRTATSPPTTPIPPPDMSRRVVLSTPLSGAEQSETHPGDPDGTGFVTFTLYPDKAQICYTVSFANIENTAGWLAHIHKAPRGSTQLVPTYDFSRVRPTSPASGCNPADPFSMAEIINNPIGFYAQLHNQEYPEGVIRGQLGD